MGDPLSLAQPDRQALVAERPPAAAEVGPRGIRVVGLLPSRIDTDRVRELDALGGDADAAKARNSATIPLRRYGTPAEFGRAAAFLLSPAASYLPGVYDGTLLDIMNAYYPATSTRVRWRLPSPR